MRSFFILLFYPYLSQKNVECPRRLNTSHGTEYAWGSQDKREPRKMSVSAKGAPKQFWGECQSKVRIDFARLQDVLYKSTYNVTSRPVVSSHWRWEGLC